MALGGAAAVQPALLARRVLVVAPHPDDETLGCGGTLLRHKAEGADLHWAIATEMTADIGYSGEQIARRNDEIGQVAVAFGFASVERLGFATTRLDTVPFGDVVMALKRAVAHIEPDLIYAPFAGDAHSDHAVVARAVAAVAKWFRAPSLKRILAYEALSETGFALTGEAPAFAPDWYVDIEGQVGGKLGILELFAGELGCFPFPRSREAVTALARWRGATAGVAAAEAFMLIRERVA